MTAAQSAVPLKTAIRDCHAGDEPAGKVRRSPPMPIIGTREDFDLGRLKIQPISALAAAPRMKTRSPRVSGYEPSLERSNSGIQPALRPPHNKDENAELAKAGSAFFVDGRIAAPDERHSSGHRWRIKPSRRFVRAHIDDRTLHAHGAIDIERQQLGCVAITVQIEHVGRQVGVAALVLARRS